MKKKQIKTGDAELLELQQSFKEKKGSKRELDMEEGAKVVGWFGQLVDIVSRNKISHVITAVVLIVAFIGIVLIANGLNNERVVERWMAKTAENHTVKNGIRRNANSQVWNNMNKLMYEANADRVSILEMHNGKENPTSLPFIYVDMTYEETRQGIMYVSDDYVNLNLSKFKFPNYMVAHGYFAGTTEELSKIDRRLATQMLIHKVKYCQVITLESDVLIGFLFISYEDVPDKILSINKIKTYSNRFTSYLDYNQIIR